MTRIVVGLPVIGAVLGIVLTGSSVQLKAFEDDLVGKDGIFMRFYPYQIDINSRTVSVLWLLGGCGSYGDQQSLSPMYGASCQMVNRRIDVYFNGGTAQDGTIWSYDPSLYPVDASGKKIYIQALNEAQTTFKLDIGADRYLGADRPQEHEYPFDRYFWGVSVALANPLNTSEEIPIVGVNPTGLANNFIPSISDDRPISQTLIMLDGTARTLKGRQVDVRFDRNATAKTFVMAIFLVNWALTLLVSHTTVLSLASKDPRVDASDKALVLPVTVILTIPSLRALFPESPPFGVNIDNVGLFLQMIIVSICSLLLLIKGSRHNERRQNFVNHVQSPHYLFSRPSLSTGEDLYVQGLANPEGGLERSSQPKRKRSQAGYETDPKSKINKVSGFSSNVSEDPDRVP